ncbi:hypothetical protein V1264_018270 [Littorina saxatilis]|uniref:G-protein coupled receptors family 1 profile domain-containing protein n=1 Tax=Littorina saxatilis TaxID=31220 RepID=A0AAN9GCM0_9CAEN
MPIFIFHAEEFSFPGFRLLYTFHQPHELPQKVSEADTWNCSVTYYSAFRQHLDCNLVGECVHGEDESSCNYTRCRPHHRDGFQVEGKCYFLRFPNKRIYHDDASVSCQEEGGRLASLTSHAQYSRVTRLLWSRYKYDVIVGISSYSALPTMYNPSWRCEDGTVVYPARVVFDTQLPVCGRISHMKNYFSKSYKDGSDTVRFAPCNKQGGSYDITASYLCEVLGHVSLLQQRSASGDSPRTLSVKDLSLRLPETDLTFQQLPGDSFITLYTLQSPRKQREGTKRSSVAGSQTDTNSENGGPSFVECPSGHVTHSFLACDKLASCFAPREEMRFSSARESWDKPLSTSCRAPMTSLPPSFPCERGSQRVPYSMVCDHRQDCQDDASDEDFCVFSSCSARRLRRCGRSQQCYSESERCNGLEYCANGADETVCNRERFELLKFNPTNFKVYETPPPPGIVDFNVTYWEDRIVRLGNASENQTICPETHFQCPGGGYCLPVYVVCNDVYDCPDHEDERECERFECPGWYRCRGSRVCLHPQHLCDGFQHCPRHDDEDFCGLSCPAHCLCHGLAFTCTSGVALEQVSTVVRYLDARSSGVSPQQLTNKTFLIYLNLASCNHTHLVATFLPNLQILDLADNLFAQIASDSLSGFPRLRVLFLTNNPLTSLFSAGNSSVPSLQFLDLSGVVIPQLDGQILGKLPNLRSLNLSGCGVERAEDSTFDELLTLQTVDLRGCSMSLFPQDLLHGLPRLKALYTDNYKLCCPALLPSGFNADGCFAPTNEISSCTSLLRSDLYRVFLFLFMILALLGNFLSLVIRGCLQKGKKVSGFIVFVTHLCLSDLLMGVYLAVIGVADRTFQDSYLWEDHSWRKSVTCKAAGFLALLSCEASSLIICLITLDRFLVLTLPFSRVRFHWKSAHMACTAVWLVGMGLAAVPLLPETAHWQFYSQTGICIPLPVTRATFAGHAYAQGIMIVFNFALFVLIAVGQVAIFLSVRSHSMSTDSASVSSRDMSVARRLFTVAASNFLCWFPVGVLGLLASRGTAIAGEVNVGLAIFVLPLNSVLNPFLYTFNVVMERQRGKREEDLLRWLKSTLDSVEAKET